MPTPKPALFSLSLSLCLCGVLTQVLVSDDLDLWEDALATYAAVPLTAPTPGGSAAGSKRGSKGASGLPSARGTLLPPVKGAAAAAAAKEGKEAGLVERRWRQRKRAGRLKLSWLEKLVEEVIRLFTAGLETTAEIAATRAPYLAMVGEELSPWEETRLNAKDHGG